MSLQTPLTCRICGNADNNLTFTAREMMFGRRDPFEYLECSVCGTLQITEIPDLRPYYPPEYLSLGEVGEISLSTTLGRRIGARLAGRYLLTGRGMLGQIVLRLKPWVSDLFPKSLVSLPGGRLDDRILEVGCGTGTLLQAMHYYGFSDLTGVDAFIESDIVYPTGVAIRKATLTDIEGEYDLVMMHHSFEHVPDPRSELGDICRVLRPGGKALIRMPVVGDAWRRYGIDWVQLDAPRHLFLFTEKGFRDLAEESGFAVERVVYDSTAMQYWGSEQYKLDIPLRDPRSHENFGRGTVFSQEQLDEWECEAVRANAEGRGDQAAYYLKKI